ncbi:MAG: nitrate/nitrite transporter [Desulfatirhabdiaceae bacterium]
MTPQSIRVIAGILLAEICSMAGFSTFAATLVEFSRLWGLSSTGAGWISSAYFMGYVLAVPVLVGLTDRIDSRKIYVAGSALGVIGGIGFAYFATDMISAMFFRALSGMSLAGTYMPGLRILTERLSTKARLRVVPYYTAAFGVGVSLSFLMSGWIEQAFDWHIVFITGGLLSVAAVVLLWIGTAGIPISDPIPARRSNRHPLDLRPVFANRDALAYILAYSGHCWELFALRAWLPAFLLFAWNQSQTGNPGTVLPRWSTLIVLIGVPASIIGAEVASQHGRRRLIKKIAIASVVLGILAGLSGTMPFWICVTVLFAYNFAVTADSGALTTGALAASLPGEQGATLAVHSILGFIGGVIGPLAVGLGLDMGGGITTINAWCLGFLFMAAGSGVAALAIAMAEGHGRIQY